MKAKGSYRPNSYEYEVLPNGTAVIRFYENIEEVIEEGRDDQPDALNYEYDRYTLTRSHSDHLLNRVINETSTWLNFAKQEEARELAADIRAQRDKLLVKTDKTQMPDADVSDTCRELYREYRQLLRDIPEQPFFPYSVEWPEEPPIEKQPRR